MTEIKLPSLGESVESGTVISILVKVGDEISYDQPLMEVETDKVTTEVPSEYDGIVEAILVKVGDEIPEGTPIIQLKTEAPVSDSQELEKSPAPAAPVAAEPIIILAEEEEEVLVETPTAAPPPPAPAKMDTTERKKGLRASPLARKVAREIGLDIYEVTTKRDSGRISVQDVKDYAKWLNQNRANGRVGVLPVELPDFSQWGEIRREKLAGITQATSKNMTTAWSQIPHAWLQEKADITDLEAKRQRYKMSVKEQGGSLTITAILVKVIAKALEQFPIFNASLDAASKEIIYKDYIHIGVAVDTDRGLLVPKIENANQKSITAIAIALGELSQQARAKKLGADDLSGATFTISNLGGIGTTSIFPIVNHPQAAILGIAASKQEATWMDGTFQPRLMMPMTIGFDHRIINGADAARFLQHIKQLLEDWFLWSL
ncbi:MAG: dihydrolipoamide acetyltransferase family protein [Bacteroidota bacterium]